MTIIELVKKLKVIHDKHGDIEVMFQDPNSGEGPFAVEVVSRCVAEEDEFPEDWNMPEGFEFVELKN